MKAKCIIELLIETLQKVDQHQEVIKAHVQQWKEQIKRWDEQNDRWREQNDRWNEQRDNNIQKMEVIRLQMAEIQKLNTGLTRNDLIDQEQSKRIEMLHQTWLDEQQVIRGMLDLLMAQNKVLKDNNLL